MLALSISMYITSYICKLSVPQETTHLIQKAACKHILSANPSNKQKLFFYKMCSDLKSHAQIALPEICTHLLNLPMVYKSHQYVTLYLYSLFESFTSFLNGGPDITNLSSFNLLLTSKMALNSIPIWYHYIHRPTNLYNLSLYEFAMYCVITPHHEQAHFNFKKTHDLESSLYVKLMSVPQIPTVFLKYPKIPDDMSSETEKIAYQNTVMLLCQPFTSFADLIFENYVPTSFQTYIIQNLNLLHRAKEEIKRQILEKKNLISSDLFLSEDIDIMQTHEFELTNHVDLEDLNPLINFTDDNKLISAYNCGFSQTVINEIPVTLENISTATDPSPISIQPVTMTIQNLIEIDPHRIIAFHIEKLTLNTLQIKAVNQVCNALLNKTPLILYLGGIGGTGKSTVIKCLTNIFQDCGWSNNLLKLAYTASAARNIDGMTIHSALGMTPPNSNNPSGKPQSLEKKLEIEQLWASLTLVICDEISQVPAEQFDDMDSQAKSALKKPNTPFGGLVILLVLFLTIGR